MTNNVRFVDREFLIIGGTSRSGTTSIHDYLSLHPEVCASRIKETRFFLDPDYPLPRRSSISDGISAYAEFFPDFTVSDRRCVYVESTPDYLYCQTAPLIRQTLPNAKVAFILRNPLDRVVSWYKFARQIGAVSARTSFEQYIEGQVRLTVNVQTPVAQRSLEQGRYSSHLERWLEHMGLDKVHIMVFDQFVREPMREMQNLCNFGGIDDKFFTEFDFERKNASVGIRSQVLARYYNWLRRTLAYKFVDNDRAWSFYRRGNRLLKPLLRANESSNVSVDVSQELKTKILAYYKDDIDRLERLIGTSLECWKA